MIEQQVINGETVTVAYLNAKMEPAEKDAAELVKIIYKSGKVDFMVPAANK